MQSLISIEKKTLTKSKSMCMYPKKETTFIVAFAVSENMKIPSTELVNDSHHLKSTTVTSSASSKTLTTNSSKQDMADTLPAEGTDTVIEENCGDGEEKAEKFNNILDMKTPSTELMNVCHPLKSTTVTSSASSNKFTTSSSKQDMTDTLPAEGTITVIEENCGDGEECSNILDCLKINKVTSTPQVIFVAQKHIRKPKLETKSKYKKLKKCKPVVIIKNIHFKNELSRNMMTKLKRYCKKTKKTWEGSSDIQKKLDSESISKKVSRTRILKKVLAKENLALINKNIHGQHEKSFPFDGSSQGTLKQEESPLSANSVIEITNPNITSFNTNIINVAVAQINNTPNLNRKSYSIIMPHKEKVGLKDSLTSYESAFSQTFMLTSKSFLNDAINISSKITISDASCSNSNISNETLKPLKTNSGMSRDTFEISNHVRSHETSNNISICTPKCSFTNQLNSCHLSDVKQKDLHTRAFYDACMTFNVYSKTRPCSSSVPDFPNNDNVLIAEDILKSTQKTQKMKNRRDERFENFKNDLRANIFQKPFSVGNAENYQKNLNLPNAAQIQSTMVDTSRPQRKCSQEVNDYPASFPQLCDKLTIILEIAVKKLEQTLSEKIANELKRSLYEFDKHIHSITKFQEDAVSECINKDMKSESATKSKVTLQPTPVNDAYLQCEIVQNEVIDKLMLTFNEEYSKSCLESSSSNYTHKLKKPKLVKDYFDILKNPLSSHYDEQEMGKGDSVQISIEDSVEQKIPKFELKKTFWTIPITIFRENTFVIASVPAFLFVMFVLYSYVMLLIRMWWY